ncbi:MAG: hypothetical protein ACRDF8_07630, partial [Chloroflexota bacterium]
MSVALGDGLTAPLARGVAAGRGVTVLVGLDAAAVALGSAVALPAVALEMAVTPGVAVALG